MEVTGLNTLPFVELEPDEMQTTDAERAHSEANIRAWREYLPSDCIDSMIAMGWDLTT
jgi:hypothetical protein